jgi:hypothetical protein
VPQTSFLTCSCLNLPCAPFQLILNACDFLQGWAQKLRFMTTLTQTPSETLSRLM